MSISTILLVALGGIYSLFWYFKTPKDVILVSADEIPQGISPGFTPAFLAQGAAANLLRIGEKAEEGRTRTPCASVKGLGPQPATPKFRPVPSGTAPLFDIEWKTLSLNKLRGYAMSVRARRFIELQVIGSGSSGYQLVALYKEKPDFSPQRIGGAPEEAGSCKVFQPCAEALAESILSSPQLHSVDLLLAYYEQQPTDAAAKAEIELFHNGFVPLSQHPVGYLSQWGDAYSTLGQYDEALEKYQEALRTAPDYCPALFGRGYVYLQRDHGSAVLNDLAYAESDFRAAVKCAPDDPAAENDLGVTLLRKWTNSPTHNPNVIQEAEQHFHRAVQLVPECATPAVNLAYLLYRRGQRQDALQQFDQLEQQFPTDAGVFLNHGYIEYLEYLAGDHHAIHNAINYTRKALRLDQKSVTAADNLGYFEYEVDNTAGAEEAFELAEKLDPQNPDILAGLALVRFKQHRMGEARKLLNEAIARNPHYCQPRYLQEHRIVTHKGARDLRGVIKTLKSKTC